MIMKRIYLLILLVTAFATMHAESSATVNAEIVQGTEMYGMRGMTVHLQLHTSGALNEMAKVRLVFYNNQGDEVPAYNKTFCADGKGFSMEYLYAIPYEKTEFNKLTYFIPFMAFSKLQHGDYYLKAWVYLTNNHYYEGDSKATSAPVRFRYSGGSTQVSASSSSSESENFRTAIKKAYSIGSAEAQYNVAMLYIGKKEVTFKLAEYLFWLNLAVKQNYTKAMTDMAYVYRNGLTNKEGKYIFVPNLIEALLLYEKLGRYDLISLLYAEGGFGIDADPRMAAEYAEKDCDSNPAKYFFLASIYDGEPVPDGIPDDLKKWYETLAKVLPVDKAKSLECNKRLYAKSPIEKENTALVIAGKYLRGEGTPVNVTAAKEYFGKAGRDGFYCEAFIFGLGGNACTQNPYIGKHMVEADVQFLQPFTVARDFRTAIEAIDKAIEMDQGNPDRLADDYKLKGLIYAAQGNEYEALRMYAKVLDFNNQYFKQRKDDPLHHSIFTAL